MSAWFAHRVRPVVTALAPSAAYELWAPSYPAEPHNALMRVEQAAVLEVLPDVAGLTGRYLRLLETRGAATIIGVDLTSAMLLRARRPGAGLVRGDLCALPLASSSIDVAVCGLALNDVAALGRALSELGRVLRPRAHLVYSVVHPRGGMMGWSRSFETPDGPQAVVTYWHSRTEHERACVRARLAIELVNEPRLPTAIANPPDGPVALVIRAVKEA